MGNWAFVDMSRNRQDVPKIWIHVRGTFRAELIRASAGIVPSASGYVSSVFSSQASKPDRGLLSHRYPERLVPLHTSRWGRVSVYLNRVMPVPSRAILTHKLYPKLGLHTVPLTVVEWASLFGLRPAAIRKKSATEGDG